MEDLEVRVKATPEASPAATTATPGDLVPLEGNSRADLPEIIILVAKLQHCREKSILLFGKLVDVRKRVLEADGTEGDVTKSSLDDGTEDNLQMKVLCHRSMLIEI